MTIEIEQGVPPTPSPSPPESKLPKTERPQATMGPWALMWANFRRRRVAYVALWLLALLYVMALIADFVGPYAPARYDLDHPYCPPQVLHYRPSRGFYVYGMKLVVDPVTFRRDYVEDRENITPIVLFPQVPMYYLLGIIPMRYRLIGVENGDSAVAKAANATFYILGTDKYGRDILSRIVHGARVSLSIGLFGVIVTFVLGMFLGGISGYLGGRTDNVIQRFTEIVNSFPRLPLWLAIAAIFPKDWSSLQVYFAITLALALLGWTGLARVVRGKILALREEEYALAARLMGATHRRIVLKHLLPGLTSHVIVALTLAVPGMILGETSLSFLGLGLRPPVVSWGVMLQDCLDIQAVRYYPWLLAPVIFVVLTVLAFNFLGDGMRDAADPYSGNP